MTTTNNGSAVNVNRAAKHLLAAVVFRESSLITMEEAGSSLLACVGYYYVGFHTAVSMLCLQPSVSTDALKQIRHSQLKTLVEEKLLKPKLLDREFLKIYNELQDLREFANYFFGQSLKEDENMDIVPTLYDRTGHMIDLALTNIRSALAAADVYTQFCIAIGDGFGDDLIRSYCAKPIEERVWEYLINEQLTT